MNKPIIHIEGYMSCPMPSEPGVFQGAMEGAFELYNAARPFPAHERYNGEFRHGVFYGVIYPDQEYANEYRKRAIELDAHKFEFVTREQVLETMQAYYDEHYSNHGIDVRTHPFKDVAQSYLMHRRNDD
jgi:hypothetical protein